MNEPIRYESVQGPLDDEEREVMDLDNGDWVNPIEGVTIGDSGAILSMPGTVDEYHHLFEAAHTRELKTHEFIRRVALATASTPTSCPSARQPAGTI